MAHFTPTFVADLRFLWRFPPFLWLLACCLPQLLQAQGGCASLTPTFENYQDCCWRLRVSNTSECSPFIKIALETTNFGSYTVNTGAGWTGTLTAPNELVLTHSNGFVPIGNSVPVLFCLPPGVSTSASLEWQFICGLGESCLIFPAPFLEACPDPQNASISGLVYRECNGLAYQNQPLIPGWTVELLDADLNLLQVATTDNSGAYGFYDLPLGLYWVRSVAPPGWTPVVPATGQVAIQLEASEQAIQNFGNCPSCTCDSVYVDITPAPGTSDTSSYFVSLQNGNGFCFPFIDIVVDSGQLVNWTLLASGWTAEPIGAQQIRLTPSGPYLPQGGLIPLSLQIAGGANHSITATVNNGTAAPCGFSFGFPQPILPVIRECCPAPNIKGPELAVNGEFTNTLPLSGYGSQYNYQASGTGPGNFSVLNGTLATSTNGSFWGAVGRSGNPSTDYFIVADGHTAPNRAVWFQNHNLLANTDYAFSAFVNNLVRPNLNFPNPQMILEVVDNGGAGNVIASSAPYDLKEIPNLWIELCLRFKTTNNFTNPCQIRIRSASQNGAGNDFAVDGVSFHTCTPPPCSVAIQVTPVNNCGLVQVSAVATGVGPFNYQWCSGQTGAGYTVQLPLCVPHTFCVSVTCADGTVSTAQLVYTPVDVAPPVCVAVPGFGVALNSNCTYTLTPADIDGGSTDNCQIQSMSISPSVLTGCGNTTITLTVTDACNNTSTCTTGVQTIEVVPPVLQCPANVSVNGNIGPNGQCTAAYAPVVSATDNCDPSVAVSSNAPTVFSGITTVTYTATDDCGNTATCSQVVTIQCCTACPSGNISGPELVQNGSFALGNTLFNSDYLSLPPTCSPGEYTVANHPAAFTLCNNWYAMDHTTGLPAGLMFMADGSTNNSTFVSAWKQQVTLTANTQYAFCAYANNLNETGFNRPDPVVEAWIIDGASNPLFQLTPGIALTENPDAWVNLNALWISPVSGTYFLAIRTTSTSFEGNNFALDDISFKSCMPDCVCGTYSNMSYRYAQGAPNLVVSCGDTLISSCNSTFPWSLGGDFMCQGGNCPAVTDMFWTLQDPSGVLVAGDPTLTGNPAFSLTIPSNTFSVAGIYTLTIGAVCGLDTCYCTFFVQSQGCSCCSDFDLFCQNVMNNVQVTVDNNLCKATLNIGNLPNCDRIDWINWGDGAQTGGPFTAGSMPMHTYSGSGTYVLSYLAVEINPATGLFCFEKILYDTITGDCDTCSCGSLVWAEFYKTWDWHKPIACNNTAPLQVPCLKPGQNYFIHGDFTCIGQNCADPNMNWVLLQPNGSTVSGTAFSPFYPHFDITLPAAHFMQTGVYTLTVIRTCGMQQCTCTFKIQVPPCNCNCNQLAAEAAKGFSVAGNFVSCKRKFSPIGVLCATDQVKWYINGPQVGATTGNSPFVYNFPANGTYWVCMVVIRTDPTTGQICSYKRCRWVTVKCYKTCTDGFVRNGAFSEGFQPGHLGEAGALSDWQMFPNPGDGAVFVDSSEVSEGGYVVLKGGKDHFGAIYQNVDWTPNAYLTLEYQSLNLTGLETPPGTVLEFRLHKDSFPGGENIVLYTQAMSADTSQEGWQPQFVSIPTPAGLTEAYRYLVACVRNDDDQIRSLIGLDNLDICTSELPFTSLLEPRQRYTVQLSPNPSTGQCTVTLPETAPERLSIRLLDVTGREMMRQTVAPGAQWTTLDLSAMPSGMYFVQIQSGKSILTTEKLMKE